MKSRNIFISYSPQDQDFFLRLYAHLKPLIQAKVVDSIWFEGTITAGSDYLKEKHELLLNCSMVLTLLSCDYFDNNTCFEEFQHVIGLHKQGKVIVVPVLLRPYLYSAYEELENLLVLPENSVPVNSKEWSNLDEPLLHVADFLKNYLQSWESKKVDSLFHRKKIKRLPPYQESEVYKKPSAEAIKNFKHKLFLQLQLIDDELQWDPSNYVTLDVDVLLQKTEGKSFKKTMTFQEAVNRSKKASSLLVLGDPGSGKSVALREYSKKMLQADISRVAIYVNLRDWQLGSAWEGEDLASQVQRLEEYVWQSMKEGQPQATQQFVDLHFRRMYRKGKFFFIFDSFDEIPAVLDTSENSEIIDKLSVIINHFGMVGNSRIMLASREFKRPSNKYRATSRLFIRPLKEEKSSTFLQKAGFSSVLIGEIYNTPALRSLIANPFTLSLIKDFLQHSDLQIPKSQTDLFSTCLYHRLKEDQSHQNLPLSIDQLLDITKKLAYLMFKDPEFGLTISLDEINQRFREVPINNIIVFLYQKRLLRLGKGRVSFIHRKFHEFFVASFFKDHPEKLSVTDIPLDNRNRDALVVYCEIAHPKIAKSIVSFCWKEVEKLNYQPISVSEIIHKILGEKRYKFEVLPNIVNAYQDKPDRVILISKKELANLFSDPQFVVFHDDCLQKYHGEDTLINDQQYVKSLNCIRFLVDAMRTRKDAIDHIEEKLSNFIVYNIQSDANLIFKKYLIESVALLSLDLAEWHLQNIFLKLRINPNTYLLESLNSSIKYLPKFGPIVEKLLIQFYSEKLNLINRLPRSQVETLKLSEPFKPVVKYIEWKQREYDLKFVFLFFILLPLAVKLSFNAIFEIVFWTIILYTIIFFITVNASIVDYNYDNSFRSKRRISRENGALADEGLPEENKKSFFERNKLATRVFVIGVGSYILLWKLIQLSEQSTGATSIPTDHNPLSVTPPSTGPNPPIPVDDSTGTGYLVFGIVTLFLLIFTLPRLYNYYRDFRLAQKLRKKRKTKNQIKKKPTEYFRKLLVGFMNLPLALGKAMIAFAKRIRFGIIKTSANIPVSIYFVVIYLALLIAIFIKSSETGKKISNLESYTLLLGLIFLISFSIYQGAKSTLSDWFTLQRIRKELNNRLSRPTIAKHFYSFQTLSYRIKYVRLLQQEEIQVSGKWLNGKLPNVNDDEASGMLAQLEEIWLGLDQR